MNNPSSSLTNQYLLATPQIQDSLFASSVVYLCEHNENGSMGLVINHQSEEVLSSIFKQLKISCDDEAVNEQPIFIGGPVMLEQGFVLHTTEAKHQWDKSLEVDQGLSLTSSKDILEAIADGKGPEDYLVLLGYSGWAAGQLEQELQDNAWLTANSTDTITFNPDIDHKWQMAFDSLGFSLDNLSPTSGNA